MSYYLNNCRELIDFIYKDCPNKDLLEETKNILENCSEDFVENYYHTLKQKVKVSKGTGTQVNKDGLWYIEDLSGEYIVLDHWHQHRAYHIDAGKRFNYTCEVRYGRKVVTDMERIKNEE